MQYLYISGALVLALAGSFFSSAVKPVTSVSSLASAPNGVYALEAELVSSQDKVTVLDSSFSVEATCVNLNKGCAGAGLVRVEKMGKGYRVLNLIKKPTRSSLNKILDAEAVSDSLIRILIKEDEWVEVSLNKSNIQAARDLVLNKNLGAYSWDENTQNLIKSE